jgi:hypothetical protein
VDERSKQLIIRNLPLLKELAETFSAYQVVKIDLIRVVYFLTQFETYERIDVIINLLKQIDFLDNSKITFLLKQAFGKLEPALRSSPIISSLGGIQDSSAVICYSLLKDLFDSEQETLNSIVDVNSIGSRITNKAPSSIIFFDDNITSGTQLNDFFQELLEGKEKAELVHKPLLPAERKKLAKVPIRICYAMQLSEDGYKKVKEIREKYCLDLDISSGRVDFNNYLQYGNSTMRSEAEAKITRDFISEIAEQLYSDKAWDADKLYHRLLGYGNLGKLTAFYYNVPKSLIPVFWKYGQFNGKQWIPLFPETQEQKKMEKDKVELDYFRIEAIQGWINSAADARKPKVEFGFWDEFNLKDELIIEVPSPYVLTALIQKNFSPKKLTYEESKIEGGTRSLGQLQQMLENVYSKENSQISERKYLAYTAAVDKYNSTLETYNINVHEHLFRFSSKRKVALRISNSGNHAANNCILKLFYNTGELLIDNFDKLEKPKFETEKPNLSDFESGRLVVKPAFSNPYRSLQDHFGSKKESEPLEFGVNMQIRYSARRIGHNDVEEYYPEIIRSTSSTDKVVIGYELNYDEEAETIKGELVILYTEVETITKELEEEIIRVAKEFRI